MRQYRVRDVFPGQTIVDACCGIGADSMAFAQARGDVIGLDIDPLRVAMARLNAEALGVDARFEVADVCDGVPDADLIFFDPGRRGNNGKRIFDVERYQPPLSTIRGWQGGASWSSCRRASSGRRCRRISTTARG
ncbi:MAG: class I SAM-dependent methyltransferase [Anaerolineae bacterium]